MIKDTIYCPGCKKEIDVHENTTTKKNENWDLYCTECGQWLCGMKIIYGWEINDN